MVSDMSQTRIEKPEGQLRRGWTTGACATAATKAALTALITGKFPDPVSILLPRGETPHFALCYETLDEKTASAGIVKDAGDDPDVTHGATIMASICLLPAGSGVVFRAGEGVGMVTRAGLPIAVGEPAINPVPRQMMGEIVQQLCTSHGLAADVEITISVPGGREIAEKTWNPRLGIIGGLSILGTTGIVHPFSCSAWIHSIHRGIDVARAAGLQHVAASTGSTSEKAVQERHNLPTIALLDMGDFAGGVLKYLRKHPLPRLTIAGGFAKMVKLAQGALDLHSARSQIDIGWLADLCDKLAPDNEVRDQIIAANTAMEVLEISQNADIDLVATIAGKAKNTAVKCLGDAPVSVDIMIVDRQGRMLFGG